MAWSNILRRSVSQVRTQKFAGGEELVKVPGGDAPACRGRGKAEREERQPDWTADTEPRGATEGRSGWFRKLDGVWLVSAVSVHRKGLRRGLS